MPIVALSRLFHLFAVGSLALLLHGCDSNASPTNATSASTAGETPLPGWPRRITDSQGEVLLQRPPQRIVSTSVTLTGTLLTINAPVIASGASQGNSTVSDAQGFFTQWSAIARQRGVQALYQGEANAEAIAAANPDLILIAGTGGDSALKLHEQLQLIAPTLVINYDDKSWQELALLLGQATGHEPDAARLIAEFDAQVSATRAKLRLPPQPSSALTYYEDDSGANLWTADSAQGKLLGALGFQLAPIPEQVRGEASQGVRKDIVQLSGENFAAGLAGHSLLLFSAEPAHVGQVLGNPFLGELPAVRQQQVYALGLDTFRLDYYSSVNLLRRLEQLFAQGDH